MGSTTDLAEIPQPYFYYTIIINIIIYFCCFQTVLEFRLQRKRMVPEFEEQLENCFQVVNLSLG